jgi:hypothetical protein
MSIQVSDVVVTNHKFKLVELMCQDTSVFSEHVCEHGLKRCIVLDVVIKCINVNIQVSRLG